MGVHKIKLSFMHKYACTYPSIFVRLLQDYEPLREEPRHDPKTVAAAKQIANDLENEVEMEEILQALSGIYGCVFGAMVLVSL